MKKHREKAKNTGKKQGKHREFCLDRSLATLIEYNVFYFPVCNTAIVITGVSQLNLLSVKSVVPPPAYYDVDSS